MAADELWMSPAYGRDTVSIHFTWKPEPEKVMPLIPKIENALKPFGPVPHWGKLFNMDAAELKTRYPKFQDFVALAKEFDPKGVWRNAFLDRNVFG